MARAIGRRMITAYLNVGVYAEFHRWLGPRRRARPTCGSCGRRGTARAPWPPCPTRSWTTWSSTAPSPSAATTIGRYVANGVDIPALAVLPFGVDLAEAVEGLAPR